VLKAVNHTRLSFAALARAPEVAVASFAEGVLEARPADGEYKDEDGVTTSLLLLGKGDGDDLELKEVDELAAEIVELDGGGTTAFESTSLPTPQGIRSPEGCMALAGGVEEPSGDSMVKRVVQVLVVVCREVNW